MNLSIVYNFVLGGLLLVRAAFVAVPAWSRWTRNLMLVREGVKTKGHYLGRCLVSFRLPDGRQVTFSTWRWSVRKTNIGDELPVLYDPTRCHLAEILKPGALWEQPLRNLSFAVASVLLAILLFLNTNIALAILISLPVFLGIYPLARLALDRIYPASRLSQFAEPVRPPVDLESRSRAAARRAETPPPPEPPLTPAVRGRAAREQLLLDMFGAPDSSSAEDDQEE